MSDRATTRVRHETRFRLVELVTTRRVTPHLVRVTVGGEQLHGFTSLGFDDHIKVFVPPECKALDTLPVAGPSGPVFDLPVQPAMRDYTPHHFDPDAGTLQLDFALHGTQCEAGPATAWALRARVGERLVIGGPRSSFLVGTKFDWHLLVGDDTALPAIRRRLAELPSGARAVVFAEVAGAEDAELFQSAAEVKAHWVIRQAGSRLADALAAASFPEGAYHA